MRKYATHKIAASSIYDLYEEYKEWINTINQKKVLKQLLSQPILRRMSLGAV